MEKEEIEQLIDEIKTGALDRFEIIIDQFKVMVGGNEAIYRIWKFDENGVIDQSITNNRVIHKSVSWIKNGTKLRYNVSSHSNDITKEKLIKLAEQLIQEN